MEINIVNRLFSNSYKYELWANIEKEIVNYFSSEDDDDNLQLQKATNFLNIGTFEVLGDSEDLHDEFERFSKVVFSKGPFMKNPYVIAFLNRNNFEGTSLSLVIKQFNDYLLTNLHNLLSVLKKLAHDNKEVLQVGRTHGVHAETTSLGHKFLVCYSDISRNIELINGLRQYIETVFVDHKCCWDSSLSWNLQKHLASKLDLCLDVSLSPHGNRERYVRYCSLMNSISQNIYKLFLDLKFMSEDDLKEIRLLSFGDAFEKIENYSKVIEASVNSLSSMVDVYDSWGLLNKVSERKYLRDACEAVSSVVQAAEKALSGLKFDTEKLNKNLKVSGDAIHSQAFMLNILRTGEFSRDEVLEDLKELTIKSKLDDSCLLDMLKDSPKYKKFFVNFQDVVSPASGLKNIDAIYSRAFEDLTSVFKNVICKSTEIEKIIGKLAFILNDFYGSEREAVSMVAFSDRSLFILGLLMPKLIFPVTTIVFESHSDLGLEAGDLVFEKSLFQSKRVLVIEYVLESEDFVNSFIEKLRSMVFVKDVRVLSLFKKPGFTRLIGGWCGKECNLRGDYLGFGKGGLSPHGLCCVSSVGDFQ